MTVNFCEHFWGEKNNGFDILYHNMKYGQVACKELIEFFRERLSIEETQCKLLARLAKQASNNSSNGTFAPVWQILKSSSEKQSNAHEQRVQKLNELIKEVVGYGEQQTKKHKSMKDEEALTIEAVHAIQTTTETLAKAKDLYFSKCSEINKFMKENATTKDFKKTKMKFDKALDDYKHLIEKYSTIRDDFEKRMMNSCQHFQKVEEEHLEQMKQFLCKYIDVLQYGHNLIDQAYVEFGDQCSEATVEKLLETFIKNKGTGTEVPGPKEFEDAGVSLVSMSQSQNPGDQQPTAITPNGEKNTRKEGLWKSKKSEGKKEKKTKKFLKKGGDSAPQEIISETEDSSPKDDARITTPTMSIPEVDEEGYSVRPESISKANDKSFYSSSDSDSEEEKEVKIHIEIKPLTNGSTPLSASIDELRASIGGLALSPLGQTSNRKSPNGELDGPMKRSVSVSQQISKPASDLLSLESLQSPSTSSASTPTGGYAFVSSPATTGAGMQSPPSTGSEPQSLEATPTHAESEDLDLFSELGDLPPALPPKHSQQQSGSRSGTPIGPPLLPRPPSRRAIEGPTGRGRMSPVSSINRADSLGSLSSEFRTSSMSVGSSRGPSPLTIGMSDIIPIAVAFQEIVHAYFKGTDESRCLVKLTGDMMVSFPAGIVQVLANNPSPAPLVFRVRNAAKMEGVVPNKQLVTLDEAQSTADTSVYEFNMAALASILRWQQEQNPLASYFNVDILKYAIKAAQGVQSTPLHLVSYWKCEADFTDLRLDYKYNGAALTSPYPLLNISVFVPVDGGVIKMHSKPTGQWVPDSHRALWRFTELSQHSDDNGTGTLKARFDLSNGPGSAGTISAQFSSEGTTLSGADFELIGLGYRVSLIKRRVITGKYICEAEPDMRHRYAPPPV